MFRPRWNLSRQVFEIAQVHKISGNYTVDEFPTQPLSWNIGTATYDLANWLAKLLSPLNHLEYTMKNSKQFREKNCMIQVYDGYKLVSFVLKSFFTNIPLEKTTEITLERIVWNIYGRT